MIYVVESHSRYQVSNMNVENRTLFHGDNLKFLRGINSNTIDLIATDPPFNKMRDFHASSGSQSNGASFKDKWLWDEVVDNEWVDIIGDTYPLAWSVIALSRRMYGDDRSAFLCWLCVRLMEMHRVLRDHGSLYLHIDYTAHAYVKILLDTIFGVENFVNEIIWFYKTGGTSKLWFNRKHDVILFYSKSRNYVFNSSKEKSYLRAKYDFPNIEILEDEIGYYRMVGVRDVWDIPALRGNQREFIGYPTQKPTALYERIIKASSDEGDLVLDPFAGSGTTLVAAERLGRKWIGMDVWNGNTEVADSVLQRLETEKHMFSSNSVQITRVPPVRTDL